MKNEIIFNGQDSEWEEKARQVAEAGMSFTLVEFNYLKNFPSCRCYIEQEFGFKHERICPNVHRFVPIPNFKKPEHGYPPGFIFSGSPED
jgi:hypothetical protein